MRISQLIMSPEKERQGVWHRFGDLELKIASSRSREYREAFQEEWRNYRRSGGRVSQEQDDRVTSRLMAEFLLLDWRNLTGDDERPLPCTRENAETLLRESKPLREFVGAIADDYTQFLDEQRTQDLESLGFTFDGPPATETESNGSET